MYLNVAFKNVSLQLEMNCRDVNIIFAHLWQNIAMKLYVNAMYLFTKAKIATELVRFIFVLKRNK